MKDDRMAQPHVTATSHNQRKMAPIFIGSHIFPHSPHSTRFPRSYLEFQLWTRPSPNDRRTGIVPSWPCTGPSKSWISPRRARISHRFRLRRHSACNYQGTFPLQRRFLPDSHPTRTHRLTTWITLSSGCSALISVLRSTGVSTERRWMSSQARV